MAVRKTLVTDRDVCGDLIQLYDMLGNRISVHVGNVTHLVEDDEGGTLVFVAGGAFVRVAHSITNLTYAIGTATIFPKPEPGTGD